METADLMLDGNALGGALGEVFVAEMTVARSTCASCGAVREIGALGLHAGARTGRALPSLRRGAPAGRARRGPHLARAEGVQLPRAARPA